MDADDNTSTGELAHSGDRDDIQTLEEQPPMRWRLIPGPEPEGAGSVSLSEDGYTLTSTFGAQLVFSLRVVKADEANLIKSLR